MDKNLQWLDWIIELQAMAQNGLTYVKDIYDKERYERLRELSAQMLGALTYMPPEKITEVFCSEKGYQTPKIDTRAAIIEDGKILLVREKNGRWSMPGGWCDVHISVKDNTVKEAFEEAGLEVEAEKLIAVQDRSRHNTPPSVHGICKFFVQCRRLGGEFRENSETTESAWFGLDGLPEALAVEKNTAEQIALCFEAHNAEHWQTVFE